MAAPSPDIRVGVRAVLQAAEGFAKLPAQQRRDIAGSLVRIGSAVTDLAQVSGRPYPKAVPRAIKPAVAQAMAAGDSFSGAAVDRIAPTTQGILNAVSFPRFVGELITGVFKAMNESNQQQLTAYVDLIKNVAATTEGFADSNISTTAARNWLVERFSGSFEVRGGEEEGFDDPSQMSEEERREWQAEQDQNTELVFIPGAEMPTEAALRIALGLGPSESVANGSPEQLVPMARAALARGRQEILASMVMMGMQRIVIDGGRLNASMRFHIDATSAAEEESGSRFNLQHESEVAARAQFGPWGAAARMKNTIGYVSTERSTTEEALNAELDLDSAVELVFRTDYVPLERLAGADDVERIQLNSINPSATANEGNRPGAERATARRTRSERLAQDLQPGPPSAPETEPMEVPGPDEAPTVPGIRAATDSGAGGQQTENQAETPAQGQTTVEAPAEE
ncbi:MAG: hypothetical protein WCY88_03655 [Spongiibacteraceae bacterium]